MTWQYTVTDSTKASNTTVPNLNKLDVSFNYTISADVSAGMTITLKTISGRTLVLGFTDSSNKSKFTAKIDQVDIVSVDTAHTLNQTYAVKFSLSRNSLTITHGDETLTTYKGLVIGDFDLVNEIDFGAVDSTSIVVNNLTAEGSREYDGVEIEFPRVTSSTVFTSSSTTSQTYTQDGWTITTSSSTAYGTNQLAAYALVEVPYAKNSADKTRFVSTADNVSHWWQIDLGKECTLSGGYFNVVDNNSNSTIKNWEVQVSTDGTTWETYATGMEPRAETDTFNYDPKRNYFKGEANKTFRYLKIIQKDSWVSYTNSKWMIISDVHLLSTLPTKPEIDEGIGIIFNGTNNYGTVPKAVLANRSKWKASLIVRVDDDSATSGRYSFPPIWGVSSVPAFFVGANYGAFKGSARLAHFSYKTSSFKLNDRQKHIISVCYSEAGIEMYVDGYCVAYFDNTAKTIDKDTYLGVDRPDYSEYFGFVFYGMRVEDENGKVIAKYVPMATDMAAKKISDSSGNGYDITLSGDEYHDFSSNMSFTPQIAEEVIKSKVQPMTLSLAEEVADNEATITPNISYAVIVPISYDFIAPHIDSNMNFGSSDFAVRSGGGASDNAYVLWDKYNVTNNVTGMNSGAYTDFFIKRPISIDYIDLIYNDTSKSLPPEGTLYYSDNGSAWTEAGTWTADSDGLHAQVKCTETGTHSYWRLLVTKTASTGAGLLSGINVHGNYSTDDYKWLWATNTGSKFEWHPHYNDTINSTYTKTGSGFRSGVNENKLLKYVPHLKEFWVSFDYYTDSSSAGNNYLQLVAGNQAIIGGSTSGLLRLPSALNGDVTLSGSDMSLTTSSDGKTGLNFKASGKNWAKINDISLSDATSWSYTITFSTTSTVVNNNAYSNPSLFSKDIGGVTKDCGLALKNGEVFIFTGLASGTNHTYSVNTGTVSNSSGDFLWFTGVTVNDGNIHTITITNDGSKLSLNIDGTDEGYLNVATANMNGELSVNNSNNRFDFTLYSLSLIKNGSEVASFSMGNDAVYDSKIIYTVAQGDYMPAHGLAYNVPYKKGFSHIKALVNTDKDTIDYWINGTEVLKKANAGLQGQYIDSLGVSTSYDNWDSRNNYISNFHIGNVDEYPLNISADTDRSIRIFHQPIISANGTFLTEAFAVKCSSGAGDAYKAFDGNTGTCCDGMNTGEYIDVFIQNPVLVTSVKIQKYTGTDSSFAKAGVIQYSNDGTHYINLAEWNFADDSNGGTVEIKTSSSHSYYRFLSKTDKGTLNNSIGEITLYGIYSEVNPYTTLSLDTSRSIYAKPKINGDTFRKVIAIVSNNYDTRRAVSKYVEASISADTKRIVMPSQKIKLATLRYVISTIKIEDDTKRKLIYDISISADTKRKIAECHKVNLNFDTSRSIQSILSFDFDTLRRTGNVVNIDAASKRRVGSTENISADTFRQEGPMHKVNNLIDTKRSVEKIITLKADTRYMMDGVVFNNYDTAIRTYKEVSFSTGTIRQLGKHYDIKRKCWTTRHILNTVNLELSTQRHRIKTSQSYSDTKIQFYSSSENGVDESKGDQLFADSKFQVLPHITRYSDKYTDKSLDYGIGLETNYFINASMTQGLDIKKVYPYIENIPEEGLYFEKMKYKSPEIETTDTTNTDKSSSEDDKKEPRYQVVNSFLSRRDDSKVDLTEGTATGVGLEDHPFIDAIGQWGLLLKKNSPYITKEPKNVTYPDLAYGVGLNVKTFILMSPRVMRRKTDQFMGINGVCPVQIDLVNDGTVAEKPAYVKNLNGYNTDKISFP